MTLRHLQLRNLPLGKRTLSFQSIYGARARHRTVARIAAGYNMPADEDLVARVEALKQSRRTGATAMPEDENAEWLAGWISTTHFEEIDSTQTYAERELSRLDLTKLNIVSADFQTAGRGTRERTWQALEGKSALMTFVFRFPQECENLFVNRNAPNATQVLAICVADIVAETLGKGHTVGLKWPNDIVVDGHKVAGILARAECSPGPRLETLLLGVGVNINSEKAELDKIARPVWPAGSLRSLSGSEQGFSVAEFREKLAMRFAQALRKFFVSGFAAFVERVNAMDVHTGQQITFRVADNLTVEGICLGVNESGHVMLKPPDGQVQTYPSGEIIPKPMPAPAADQQADLGPE
eukprot:TRINITY_DN32120_c0_g1_i1.p1 TRINITY_DN32120_c0_g1~~TRINITY_DN32120_c0_g1_i1.p1  ORF type:complete len:353 (+),score=24.15 TRINITY_DN32120_c0_g1_i1:41-1099(+)